MSQEQNFDFHGWWNAQAFTGKELYKLDDSGTLSLAANNNVKEREIAHLTPENADTVIRNLTEKFASVDAKVKELEIEWIAAEDKLKLADKVAYLKEHINSVQALGDMQRLGQLIHDWEHTIFKLSEEAHAEKLKLVELAESLAESTEWKETTQAFKDITEKWKQTGQLDKHRSDKLWNRIEAARTAFYDRKRLHHQEEEKDLLHNLDLKLDLVERAEALAGSQEWKKTSEIFHKLTEEWKTIGHTLSKKNEELWQRFIAAKSAFFDKKREHAARVQVEHAANYAVKLAIVERAESMKESQQWNVTTQEYAALMDEWKKTGRTSHEKGEELWQRFQEARDHFFNAKRKHTEEIRTEQEENYAKKKAILDRAERIKNSTHWSDTTAEMNDLMDEWKKIGNAGKAHSNKLWEDFLAARKHFFNRKDASRDMRRQQHETHKIARIDQAKGFIMRLEGEITEEEAKLADFKVDIQNITPGKKAEELRKHLDQLIQEGGQKIKRLHEKLQAAKDELADAMAKAERENKENKESKPQKDNNKQQKKGPAETTATAGAPEASAILHHTGDATAQPVAAHSPAPQHDDVAEEQVQHGEEPRTEHVAHPTPSQQDEAPQPIHEPAQEPEHEPVKEPDTEPAQRTDSPQ